MSDKPIPLSLRRKSSARVAAVQCVYRLALTGDDVPVEKLLADYFAHEDEEAANDAKPDTSFLKKLLTGAVGKKPEIDTRLRASLSDKWTAERTSPLLMAILTCALYEMHYAGGLKAPIVIDEYVTLTGRFFGAQEVGFVNGLLDAFAKESK